MASHTSACLRTALRASLTSSRYLSRHTVPRIAVGGTRSITVDTSKATEMVNRIMESNSGYRHRHGMDIPGSHQVGSEVDALERAVSISGSEAFAHNQVQSRDGTPSPQLVMSDDLRYHSSFPQVDVTMAPQSPRGILDLDRMVGAVRRLYPSFRRGPMVVEGEHQERPITGAASKMNKSGLGSSLSKRHFSTAAGRTTSSSNPAPSGTLPLEDPFTAEEADVAKSGTANYREPSDLHARTDAPPPLSAAAIDLPTAPITDPFSADEADIAKAGTSNYRRPTEHDHPYTNIDLSTGVSTSQSSVADPDAQPFVKGAGARKDVRDAESPTEFSDIGINPDETQAPIRASAKRGNFDLDRSSGEYFPETMHLEEDTAEYLASGPHKKMVKRAMGTGDSGILGGTPGYYPDTMILEPEVKRAIPASGLPPFGATGTAAGQPKDLAEKLHESAGYFPDSGVSDPVDFGDAREVTKQGRTTSTGAGIRKM